jgi:hypothetical protein
MSQKPADPADDVPRLLEQGDPAAGDQAPCLRCAAKLVMQLGLSHPKNGMNTLLVAMDMWIQRTAAPEHQAAAYRVIAQNFEIAAATTEAEQAGVSIGPAQGRA